VRRLLALARTAPVRVGLFADVHHAERVYGDRYCSDSAAKLAACVRCLQAATVDLLVCLGDLIDTGPNPGAEAAYVRAMARIVAGFPGACCWVLGNHDLQALGKAEFLRLCGAAHPAYYSFDVRGVHFVVLDGNCHADGSDFHAGDFSWDDAWVAAAQLDWLAADLAQAAGRPAVIFCHENLDHRLWQGAPDPHLARNAAQVRQVLAGAGNVAAVVQAHYHPGMATRQDGIPYLGLRAMVVGPGLENNAFGVLEVDPGGAVALAGYGQQGDWTPCRGRVVCPSGHPAARATWRASQRAG